MHPRDHLILSSAAAAAAYPLLGWRVLLPWAASLLADLDHIPTFIGRRGLASPIAMWRNFRSAEGGEQRYLLNGFDHAGE